LAIRRKRTFQKRDTTPKHKINLFIKAPKIRLVGDNFDELSEVAGKALEPGIYGTAEAVRWARGVDLDLVEINPKADPPVCKIIDYKKFLYQTKKREKEMKAKTKKTVVKEIRFGPNTDEHDFQFKLKHAQKFLEEGAKVKAYVHFRGRTIVFKDRGELLLLRLLNDLQELGSAEELPKLEGRRMIVIISPKKSGKKSK